jgi:hypothetical protein
MRGRILAMVGVLCGAAAGCDYQEPNTPIEVGGRQLSDAEARELREWSDSRKGGRTKAGVRPIDDRPEEAKSASRGRTAAKIIGIVLVSAGAAEVVGLAITVGIVAGINGGIHNAEGLIIPFVAGAGVMVAGLPLLIYGARSPGQARATGPFVSVGPGSVAVAGSF